MVSKKAMQVEIDNLHEALRLMEKSRDIWQKWCEHESNKVSQLRDALEKQNDQATELHHDNAQLNNTIFDQVIHANAQSDFIAAQSDYITHLVNR